jgi:hypothetical protein
MMKKILSTALLMTALIWIAEAQIQTPAPSSAGSVSSVVGLTDVTIDYSRPKAKGRKIFGAGSDFLVPYGQIWRTGANNGTKITFSEDVEVEGTKVTKGSYLIFTWPGASEWTISLYSDVSLGGNTGGYDAAKETAKFTVKSEKLGVKVETFTMAIGDISEDNTTAKVQIAWENTSAKFTVNVDYDAVVMKAIEANTKVNPGNLIAAAQYYYNTNKDLAQALKWTNEYLAAGNNSTQFWNVHFKAQLQKALGDKKGAEATAKQSIEIAKKAENDFGYIKLNEDLIKSLK